MVVPHSRSLTRILAPLLLIVFVAFLASCSGEEAATTTAGGVDNTTVSEATPSSTAENGTDTSGTGTLSQPGGSNPSTPPSDSTATSGPPQPGGEYAERLPELEQAVKQNPEDLIALGQLAIGYFQTQSYAKAEEVYKKMLGIKDSAEVHNNLGNVYRDWKKTEQAIEQYEKAIDLDPTLVTPYSNLAALYMMGGDVKRATEVAQAGIEKTSGAARQQLQALLDSLQ